MSDSQPNINALATAISASAPNVGIDPLTIIAIAQALLSIIGWCYKQTHPTTQPADYIKAHYLPGVDQFDETILAEMRSRTLRATRKTKGRDYAKHLTCDQVDAISTATLKQVMTQNQTATAMCLAECKIGRAHV